MPTGYTHEVAEGTVTDFRTFALRCARNFGATILQRDEPSNVLPRLQEPSPFYAEQVQRAEGLVARYSAMSIAHAESALAAERDEAIIRRNSYRAETRQKRERYKAMIAEAAAWIPPTQEHVGMKDFMLQQLCDSLEWDCGGDYAPAIPDFSITPEQWLFVQREEAGAELMRARKSLAEEIERTNSRNAWIQALYKSLETAPVIPRSDNRKEQDTNG